MLRWFSHILMVAMVLFGMSAPCLCHVHLAKQSCCQKVEAQDCCCNKAGTMANEVPAPESALLPVVWEFPQVCVAALLEAAVDVVPSSFIPSRGRTCQDVLRSPPNLYLLHASFLI